MIKGLLSVSIMSVTAAILLTGCGGGDDTATTPTASTGYYVDAAVSGVSYVCGDQNGTTGTDGSFKFQKDQGCTFSLAGITLRTIAAANLVDQVKILEDNVSVAQMLQTLDSDGNASNGITITPAVIAAVRTANITTPPVDDAAATALHTAVQNVTGYTGSAKTIADTNAHLIESQTPILKALIAGKTFYLAESYSSTSKDLISLNFNANVTSLSSTLLNTTDGTTITGTPTIETIEINGTKIMFHNTDEPTHLYEQYVGQTADYIILRSNPESLVRVNDDALVRLYFDKTKAEAYYATLSPTSATTTTPTTSTFDAKALLAGKTFYPVYVDNNSPYLEKVVVNSDGTQLAFTAISTQSDGNYTEVVSMNGNTITHPATGDSNAFTGTVIASEPTYIEIQTDIIERWYFIQANAQTYYNTLLP